MSAIECCQEMLNPKQGSTEDDDEYLMPDPIDSSQATTTFIENETNLTAECPPTWDGWTCWRRTPANRMALAKCPHYIYFETEPPACSRK